MADEKKDEKPTEKLTEMVERLEKANEQAREILKRQEELIARNLLGGKTESVGAAPVKKEVSDKEYKDHFLKYGRPPEGMQ